MSGPHASRARRAAVLLGVVACIASGCSNSKSAVAKNPHSGDATASPVGGVQQVVMTSGPDLRFHPSTITVHPGKVRVVLKNVAPGGGPPHNIQAPSVPGLAIGEVDAGQTQSATFTAPAPGRYSFVCTFHRAQGQYGTLVVKTG
ncbi:plastocyanin/azurin family copper-binding protein [uncultured Jatrophihabitans sp.]|uniref:plastocyanin/azurin family copper-binding protein n=1 Tax=uncultured Jatrophihabitans sp. TaxID=1610747 RepID=UPI0035CA355E